MLSLFRWLARQPLWLLHAVGGPLGWLTYLLSPSYGRRFRENVAQAGVDPRAARPAIAQAGRPVMESPFLWMRPTGQPTSAPVMGSGGEPAPPRHAARRGLVFRAP